MNCCTVKPWLSFWFGALVILVVWTVILPWVGSRQSVHRRIEYMDRNGIDPAALYYTDLEAMQRLESDVAAITKAHADAFWSVRSAASD